MKNNKMTPSSNNANTLYVKRITRLSNSNHFYFHIAIIIEEEKEKCYRLITIRNGELIDNITYETLRGARIAFTRMHMLGTFNDEIVKPIWSEFYRPETNWIKTRIESE
jgi:hypothetical protein